VLVGTYNLRLCPHPDWYPGTGIAAFQAEVGAAIWMLTEVHRDWRSAAGAVVVSPPRGGENPDTKRWAGIQTALPMKQILDDAGGPAAAEESLCLARVELPEDAGAESVLVACSVLPWGGAATYWPGLPPTYLDAQQQLVLAHHIDRIENAREADEPVLWGGDFNQELVNLTPERVAAGYRIAGTVAGIERLSAAFRRFGLSALTARSEHLNLEAPSIDHIAVSEHLARGAASVHRPLRPNGKDLSDHAAYIAEIGL
jgi:hypothetical protein